MANRFIIDTDVCIDFLRGQINNNVYISILTYYEFLKGAYSKKEEKAINDFVEGFEILNLDKEITRIGAEFYRK